MSGPKHLLWLLLVGFVVFDGAGCARRSRTPSVRPNLPVRETSSRNSSKTAGEAPGTAMVGDLSNAATGSSAVSSGSNQVRATQNVAPASASEISPEDVAVGLFSPEDSAPPAKESKSSGNPILGFFSRKGDPEADKAPGNKAPENKKTDRKVAQKDDSPADSPSDESESEEDGESKRQTKRSRASRLLSMLGQGLGWGNEEQDAEETDDEEASEITVTDTLDDETSTEEESADEESPTKIADLTTGSEKDSNLKTVEGEQTDSSGEKNDVAKPARAIPFPVGISNRSIQTVQSLQEGLDSGAKTLKASSQSLNDGDASRKQHVAEQSAAANRVDARRSARQMAMRNAMLPGASSHTQETADIPELNRETSPPAAVVRIPNRLSAPHLLSTPQPWEYSVLKEWFPIGGLVLGGLIILGLGIRRRRGKRQTALPRLKPYRTNHRNAA